MGQTWMKTVLKTKPITKLLFLIIKIVLKLTVKLGCQLLQIELYNLVLIKKMVMSTPRLIFIFKKSNPSMLWVMLRKQPMLETEDLNKNRMAHLAPTEVRITLLIMYHKTIIRVQWAWNRQRKIITLSERVQSNWFIRLNKLHINNKWMDHNWTTQWSSLMVKLTKLE